MRFFYLVWCNLKRKKLRTALTLLSIFVAFVLFAFLGAIRQSLTGYVSVAGADRLVVRHKVSLIQLLPETYKARMERIPGVVDAVHQTWFGGIYQDPKNFFMQNPVEPEEFMKMFPEFLLSEAEMKAWLETRTGAIVGRATANRFGWKIGQRVAIQSPIWWREGGGNTWEFDIVGIFDGAKKATDVTSMYFRYDYFEEARAGAKGQVGWYTVRVADPARAVDAASALDAEFENSPYETKTEPEGVFAQGFAQQVGDIGAMVTAILAAVFFTILLVAGNTMAQSVRERTEEIGVLKSLGFSNELVLGVVLAESCLIAALGGLVGLGLGAMATAGMSDSLSMLPGFFLPGRDVGWGVALVVGLGLVAGLFPALQAMRLRIADALRRQI
jgi:putative ABC transport system permease protein